MTELNTLIDIPNIIGKYKDFDWDFINKHLQNNDYISIR